MAEVGITTPGKRYNAQGEHVNVGEWLDVIRAINRYAEGTFRSPLPMEGEFVNVERYPDFTVTHNEDETTTVAATTPHGVALFVAVIAQGMKTI